MINIYSLPHTLFRYAPEGRWVAAGIAVQQLGNLVWAIQEELLDDLD